MFRCISVCSVSTLKERWHAFLSTSTDNKSIVEVYRIDWHCAMFKNKIGFVKKLLCSPMYSLWGQKRLDDPPPCGTYCPYCSCHWSVRPAFFFSRIASTWSIYRHLLAPCSLFSSIFSTRASNSRDAFSRKPISDEDLGHKMKTTAVSC